MPNWGQVLQEIQQEIAQGSFATNSALNTVRQKYLLLLHQKTGRNIIAYYSGFLSKPEIRSDINDEDKNGFMMAVHGLDRRAGLDLILHTPGGGIAATQSIMGYLQKMFQDDVRVVVPQIAMSAGTIMACCCKEILMSEKHANLGPIDPHLDGFPAYGVIQEFRRAIRETKKDPSTIPIWQAVIGQYYPTYLSQCENAIQGSNRFVTSQLRRVMFKRDRNPLAKARLVVKKLTDYSGNKGHDRHIDFGECKRIGLKVSALESDQTLQDLALTVHHCYMHLLMNTTAFKVIENQAGAAFVKNIQMPASPR
jgi:ATP-dependent protease ClpP protease subunit